MKSGGGVLPDEAGAVVDDGVRVVGVLGGGRRKLQDLGDVRLEHFEARRRVHILVLEALDDSRVRLQDALAQLVQVIEHVVVGAVNLRLLCYYKKMLQI
jgi:hypothetical protein